jgi:hypothetical protein
MKGDRAGRAAEKVGTLRVRRHTERGDQHGARRDGEEIEKWPSHVVPLLLIDQRAVTSGAYQSTL